MQVQLRLFRPPCHSQALPGLSPQPPHWQLLPQVCCEHPSHPPARVEPGAQAPCPAQPPAVTWIGHATFALQDVVAIVLFDAFDSTAIDATRTWIGLLVACVVGSLLSLLLVQAVMWVSGDHPNAREALIAAGEIRLRPIIMTTLAMIFGMVPLAFALTEGSEQRAPMGQAVIGGVITSSLLTLVVVPVVYCYMDDLAQWLRRKAGIPASRQGLDTPGQ